MLVAMKECKDALGVLRGCPRYNIDFMPFLYFDHCEKAMMNKSFVCLIPALLGHMGVLYYCFLAF